MARRLPLQRPGDRRQSADFCADDHRLSAACGSDEGRGRRPPCAEPCGGDRHRSRAISSRRRLIDNAPQRHSAACGTGGTSNPGPSPGQTRGLTAGAVGGLRRPGVVRTCPVAAPPERLPTSRPRDQPAIHSIVISVGFCPELLCRAAPRENPDEMVLTACCCARLLYFHSQRGTCGAGERTADPIRRGTCGAGERTADPHHAERGACRQQCARDPDCRRLA